MPKILVSIISYGEKDLASTVAHCYENAKNKQDVLFSIVDEQPREDGFSSFPEVPAAQMLYRKYDTSAYRGILWARDMTTRTHFDYDYILYICGHERFAEDWDVATLEEYEKAVAKSSTGKAVLTYCQADFSVTETSNFDPTTTFSGRTRNVFHYPNTLQFLTPGYGFPGAANVPDDGDVHEGCWLHFTWCFASKQFVEEVPLNPEINFHAEEPYMGVLAWCRDWRFFATARLLSWHQVHKKYPDEKHVRIDTHRPWADNNKKAFWKQSNDSLLKLNKLLSGKMGGKYGGVTWEKVLEYCCFSGLNTKWTQHNPNYDKLSLPRHGQHLKDRPIVRYEKV
jgi:hypothetical protein